ncbi:hypothetical protein AAY473_013650 [Plecturocebus cupreus]
MREKPAQKRLKIPKPECLLSCKGTQFLASKGQNWMEKKFDELTEVGFRRWVITNSSELQEHVLTQCKKAKNFD